MEKRLPATVTYRVEEHDYDLSHIELLTPKEFELYQKYVGRRKPRSWCCGQNQCFQCLIGSDLKLISVNWYQGEKLPSLIGTFKDLSDIFYDE